MIYENIESFLEGLIEVTKKKKMKWEPLTSFANYQEIDSELDVCSGIDFMVNSISMNKSYYLKNKKE